MRGGGGPQTRAAAREPAVDGGETVAERNRRTALGLLAWVALLALASVVVAWVRN